MTAYKVQLYREQRLVFRGIEADSPRDAAFLASAKPTSEAQSAAEAGGFDHSAVVDPEGEDFNPQFVNFRADGGEIAQSPPQITNRLRASWAEAALSVFLQHSDSDRRDAVGDLLSALMHLALQDNLDLPAALERGFSRFEAELAQEGQAASHLLASLTPPRRFREAAWQMLKALEALLPHLTQELEEQRATGGFPAYSDFEKAVATALAAVKGGEPTACVRSADVWR